MNQYINLANTRSEEQEHVMKKIHENGHCPFCRENLLKYHKKPIIKEGGYWVLTENQWPYKKVRNQLLAVHKEHIEHIRDLSPEAAAELISMFKEESAKRNIPGGGVAIRFGSNPDKGNYGSTVLHIHAHLIEPDLEALSEDEAFKIKLGQPKNYKSGK